MGESALVQYAVMGVLWGVVCGIGPLVYAVRRGREGMAVVSVCLCAAAGAVFGVFLALPVALAMFAVLLAGENDRK